MQPREAAALEWLPEPPTGTQITVAFDGSDTSDWSGFAAETREGYSFTPRRSASDDRPTIWRPDQEVSGRIPRQELADSLADIVARFNVARVYADPWRYETDLESWSLDHPGLIVAWTTNQPARMHAALEQFYVDLSEGRIKHDGCPLTMLAMDNARKITVRGDRYILAKPSDHQKIDPAMTRVLAHKAACDVRAEGWPSAADTTAHFAFSF